MITLEFRSTGGTWGHKKKCSSIYLRQRKGRKCMPSYFLPCLPLAEASWSNLKSEPGNQRLEVML